MPAWRGYVLVSLIWLAVLGGAAVFLRRPTPQPIEILPPPTAQPSPVASAAITGTATARATDAATSPAATATVSTTPTPPPLHVDVAGAVGAPGVYTLPTGSRVIDAIAAAGGALAEADLDRLNKAAGLTDGVQIYVPRLAERGTPLAAIAAAEDPAAERQPAVGQPPATRAATTPAPTVISVVDINTATLEALDTLPGVGPATAQAIIAGRPYARVEDLLRVDGIGEAKFAKLQPYVAVR
jgi:competence protein ComEA